MKTTRFVVLTLAAVAAVSAHAQQPVPVEAQKPKAAEQSVVAPSLPDQPNKEGNVTPSGGIRTDEYGNILQNIGGAVDPNATPNPGAPPVGQPPPVAAPGASAGGPAPYPVVPTPPPGPTGPAVVGAAYLSVTGTVKAYEKGASITIVEQNGRERKVAIMAKATVYDGIAVGDKVVLKVPLKKSADGKSTDKIMKWQPPKAPPKSNFSAQESPIVR
jgi:hypothetical protein